MNVLITGVAGFIGSTLARRCLDLGWTVVGCDNFSHYYDVEQKRHNIAEAQKNDAFRMIVGDITDTVTPELLAGVDVVFHQAGQPGVRASWSTGFGDYVAANIVATQALLERCRAGTTRVVMASSSSVYGNAEKYPVLETTPTRPYSPYGVTKLAAERLAVAYADNFGLPIVALRYFTVYGPRQRPDMAMHRLARAALTGEEFAVFGTGEQIRDFTYVDDVVEANIAAATAAVDGAQVLNICGGSTITLNEVIELLREMSPRPLNLRRQGAEHGDVFRTGGVNDLARSALSWQPTVAVADGLRRELDWMDDWLTSGAS